MVRLSRLKVEFTQTVVRQRDNTVCVTCKNTGLAIDVQTGKPCWLRELDEILARVPIRSAAT
jgi:acyl-CoA thioesterase FadM